MTAISSSLPCLLTILLLTGPNPSTAAPPPEPMVTQESIPSAEEDTQLQGHTYLPADELAELKESFEQFETGVKEARQALSLVTQQREDAQQKSAQLAEANKELRAQLAAAQAELDEARRQIVQVRQAHQEELNQVRGAAAQVRRELDEVRQVLAQTQQQRDEQRRETERLKGKLASGREAFDLLTSLRDQLEATSTEVRGLKSDVASVRGELQAPAQRKALNNRVRTLEQERQRLTGQLASEQQSLAAVLQQREALKQSVSARDVHKRELLKTVLGLQSRLDTAEARLVQALDKQQAARAEAATLRQQAEQRKKTIESLMQDLRHAKAVDQPANASRPAAGTTEEQVAQRDNRSITVPTP